MKSAVVRLLLTFVIMFFAAVACARDTSPKACRSVHLAFDADEGTAFYNEIVVDKSAPGTYFMSCGFSTGYFGIQELANGKKVVLFSVWEPGKQNNPDLTPEDRRVKVVASGNDVRVRRFGGEGTGGQSFYDYQWRIGQRCRFVVHARRAGDRTEYAGYFYVPDENRWHHMATFSTLANGQLLRGYYSFIEDFRRNFQSAKQPRQALFANGWALVNDTWQPLTMACFTADRTPTDNIDAGHAYQQFFLVTGGGTKNEHVKLRSKFALPEAERLHPLDLPDPFGDGRISRQAARILTYNIKHGRGNDGEVDLARIASVIRRLNPDIVALQEVDKGVERSGKVDQPAVLSKLTGLKHNSFGLFFDYQGGEYGMAILSRFPIRESTNLKLPKGAEYRASLIARIAMTADSTLTVSDVHFYRTEDERLAQAQALLDYLNKQSGDVVVAGDFNSRPDSPVLKLFESGWHIPDKGDDRFTFSSDRPDREIDFAILRRDSTWVVSKIDVVDEPIASDHRPVVLEISELANPNSQDVRP